MRIDANQPQSCPQGDRPTFVSNEPETGDTGHQRQKLEQDVSRHPTDHSVARYRFKCTWVGTRRAKVSVLTTDPIQYKRL